MPINSGYSLNESRSTREERVAVRRIAEEVLRQHGKNNSIGTYDKFIGDEIDKWAGSGHDHDFIRSVIEKNLLRFIKKENLSESAGGSTMDTAKSNYEEFVKKCQENPIHKKAAAICKKFGYEIADLCYVEVGKTGRLYVNFGIMQPYGDYRPEVRYQRDRFLIQTTSHGSLTLEEHAEFIRQLTNAQKMVTELSKLDLTKLYQLQLDD